MDVLDEKGFVFIDGNNKPFHVRMWGDNNAVPWLFYWHPDKRWVSLRQLNGNEVLHFGQNKLSDEHAQIYHDQSERDF